MQPRLTCTASHHRGLTRIRLQKSTQSGCTVFRHTVRVIIQGVVPNRAPGRNSGCDAINYSACAQGNHLCSIGAGPHPAVIDQCNMFLPTAAPQSHHRMRQQIEPGTLIEFPADATGSGRTIEQQKIQLMFQCSVHGGIDLIDPTDRRTPETANKTVKLRQGVPRLYPACHPMTVGIRLQRQPGRRIRQGPPTEIGHTEFAQSCAQRQANIFWCGVKSGHEERQVKGQRVPQRDINSTGLTIRVDHQPGQVGRQEHQIIQRRPTVLWKRVFPKL